MTPPTTAHPEDRRRSSPPVSRPAHGAHAGRMTAVMRTASVEGTERVLRVAVIERGRVVEERLARRGADVTVGSIERNSLVVLGERAPGSFRLFELRGDACTLHLFPGITGRVATGGELIDLSTRASQRGASISLAPDARGKLVVGDATLLFQRVAAPPRQPRAQLPEGVKNSLVASVDWTMTIIAAFSFLAHFGAVGTFYTDWSDSTVLDSDSIAAGIIHHLEIPPHVDAEDPTPVVEDPSPQTASPAPSPSPNGPRTPGSTANSRPTSSPRGPDLASVSRDLARMDREILAALSPGNSPSTQSVMSGNLPAGSLGMLAERDGAVSAAPGSLHMGVSGGPVLPGGKRTLADGIAGSATGATERAGTGGPVLAPVLEKKGKPEGPRTSPPRTDAERVLAGARARARACFINGQKFNPDMEGGVSFSLSIAGDGHVTSATMSPSGSLSSQVTQCVQGVLTGLHFDTSENGRGSVSGSFRFVNGNKPR
jgi:hypothetical protein